MGNKEKPPSGSFPNYWRQLQDRVSKALGTWPQTLDELMDVMQRAQQNGLLDQDALDTIQRVLQVSELQVREITIPRPRMVVVEKDQPPEEFLPILIESAHSRFPVIDDGDRDKVIGVLLAKDMLSYFYEDTKGSFNLRDILRPAVFIPESKRLNVLLTEFRANRNHMAIVVDEYGGVAGLVTIEDVLEQIVGDIEDEHDIGEEDMLLQRGENEFVAKALFPLEEFNERFGTDFDTEESDTIGGLVVKSFGHVPQREESIIVGSIRFEILHADSRRVHLIRVSNVEQP